MSFLYIYFFIYFQSISNQQIGLFEKPYSMNTQTGMNPVSNFGSKNQLMTNQQVKQLAEELQLVEEKNQDIRNNKETSFIIKNQIQKKQVFNQSGVGINFGIKSNTFSSFTPINWSNLDTTQKMGSSQRTAINVDQSSTSIRRPQSNENSKLNTKFRKQLDSAKHKVAEMSSQKGQNKQFISSLQSEAIENSDSSNSNRSALTDASGKKQQKHLTDEIQNSKILERYGRIQFVEEQDNKLNKSRSNDQFSQKTNEQKTTKEITNSIHLKIKNSIQKLVAQQKLDASLANKTSQDPNQEKRESSFQVQNKVQLHPQRTFPIQQNVFNLSGLTTKANYTSASPSIVQSTFQNRNASIFPINNIFQPNPVSQQIFTQSATQNVVYSPPMNNFVSKTGFTSFSSQNLKSLRWQHHRMKIMQLLSNKPYDNSYKQLIAIITSNFDEQDLSQFVERHHSRLAQVAQLIMAAQISKQYQNEYQQTNIADKNIKAYNISDLVNSLQNLSQQLNSEDKQTVDAEILQEYESIKDMTVHQFQLMMNASIEQSFVKLKDIVSFQVQTDNHQIHKSLKDTQLAQKDYYKLYNQLIDQIDIIEHNQDSIQDYLSLFQDNLYQDYYITPKHHVTYLIQSFFESQSQLEHIQNHSNSEPAVIRLTKQLIQSMVLSLNKLSEQIGGINKQGRREDEDKD